MDFSINQILSILKEKSIEFKLAESAYEKNKISISKDKKILNSLEKIRTLIIEIGKDTQEELKKYIEETVTLALQTVFGEDYCFLVEFNYDKRDQYEINFFIEHLGIKLEPKQDTCAGGEVDVCAFVLRMICLTLEDDEVAAILILDEPFKNVSSKYISAVGQMIIDISHLLNVQIIMVTHIEDLIESSDNVIYI